MTTQATCPHVGASLAPLGTRVSELKTLATARVVSCLLQVLWSRQVSMPRKGVDRGCRSPVSQLAVLGLGLPPSWGGSFSASTRGLSGFRGEGKRAPHCDYSVRCDISEEARMDTEPCVNA